MKRYLLFLLLIPLAASSCLRDEYFRTRSGKGEREVEIKLFAPGMGGDTRAGEITDTGIVTVDILVFQGAGGGSDTDNAVYDYTRYAWHKSGNVYSTVLKTGSDLDIYFAINARGIISTVDLTGKTFGEARQMLRMTGSPKQFTVGAASSTGLPMWGALHSKNIEDKAVNNFGPVQLVRSVASVDVELSGTAASKFTLAKGYIAYAADRGLLAWSQADMTGDFKAVSAGVPSDMTAATTLEYTPTATGKILNSIYIYENDAPTNTARRSTKLILEGTYNDGTLPTFYPLSLREWNADRTAVSKSQVRRNMKFRLEISDVLGDGYPSLDAAKEGEDINVDFTVVYWNGQGDGEVIIAGTNYISIGRDLNENRGDKTAVLYRDAESFDTIGFSTDIPLADFSMTLTGGALPDPDDKKVISNDRFRVEIVTENDKHHLLFTALQSYGTFLNPSTLTVSAGRISFDITLVQRDASPEDWTDGGEFDGVWN